MDHIVEDMKAILDSSDELMHYGMPRRSGRYPWGSGEDSYQNACDFLGRVSKLRKQGFTFIDEEGKKWTGDNAIAKSIGLTSSEFRNEISAAKDERKITLQKSIKTMREDGKGWTEIGNRLHLRESTVRSLVKESTINNANQARKTADFIREQVDKRGMIDVGSGVERELNISRTKLDNALHLLYKEGYEIHTGGFDQVTNKGQRTHQKVICPPGTPAKDIYQLDKVHSLNEHISRDNGETFEKKFNYPKSLDSKRVLIRYNEEGGLERDGTIELRRNVEDLSLGESRYSQVRILVDNTHYMKGMAIYSDNMPDGVDVGFNTNKPKGTPASKVFKEIKPDPDNPFGSLIKDAEQGGQYWYTDKNGKKQLGLINKTRDEGDWSEWKDALPSQFLGKQNLSLARKQLNLAKEDKYNEYQSIMDLENPTIKKHFLKKFADECDTAAVDLKAAALPGQKYHVIIPMDMKETEVYAPNYPDGSKLALIRYPHGGTFEIPVLTVNNKIQAAKKTIGSDGGDAICINSKVAERLSGADFDGDTVMCIPTDNGRVKISRQPYLEKLVGFDPKTEYGPESYAGRNIKIMRNTNTQMGIISNLITDMTLLGAGPDELAAAVRHSMVVIDAEKHKLDYRKSEIDHNIAALHKKWQGHYDADGNWHNKGASTILSRAKGEQAVTRRKGEPKINMPGKSWYDPNRPEGAYIYTDDPDATYTYTKTNKRAGGEVVVTKTRTQKSTNMAETDDANTLVSATKHPMELLYADYANSMKSLANQARKEYMTTGKIPYSANAKQTYAEEVRSLESKLNTALLNQTKERAAQRRANVELETKKNAYLEETGSKMKPSDAGKIGQQALTKARMEVGAVSRKKRNITITDREWEAIQAGAITENKLFQILNNSDPDTLRQRAMPKAAITISPGQRSRIKNLAKSGYTIAEIARKLGKSPSTISDIIQGVK